jgi:hypothetical protein
VLAIDAASVHGALAWVLIGVNAAAGAWSLAAQRITVLDTVVRRAAVLMGHLSAFALAVSGVVLADRPGRTLEDFHALYGFSALIAVAIVYSYRRSGFVQGRVAMLDGFGCLFIMGLGIRNLYL